MVREKDFLSIGRVVKLHGVHGKIKVDYFGDDLDRFSHYHKILIMDAEGRLQTYQVAETTRQPPRLIVRLEGVTTVEKAQPLIGKEIFVDRDALPPLEEGEYYWFEVLGMSVETKEGKRIGEVKKIFPTGANDVYVVQGKRREIFLPATDEVIQEIDTQKRLIRVTRIEGLWEDEDEV